MKGLVYELGTILENKEDKYKIKIVQIDKGSIDSKSPKYRYVVQRLDDLSDRKKYQMNAQALKKFYKVVSE